MPRHKIRITDTDVNNIIDLYKLNYSIDQIKAATNIASNIIRKYIVMEYGSKISITSDEISYFREAYESGKTLADISNDTGRSISIIRVHIRDLISSKEKIKEKNKLKKISNYKANMTPNNVIDIYLNTNYDIKDIAKYYNKQYDIIKEIIKKWVNINMPFEKIFSIPFDTAKMKIFRDFYCNIGDEYKTIINDEGKLKNINYIIEDIYPKIVVTNKGHFTYKDIILNSELIHRNIKK